MFRLLLLYRKAQKRLRSWASSSRAGPAQALAPRHLPRRIWMYWDTGEASAPHVVSRCFERWRELHPHWELEILDRPGAERIIDMSDMPDGILPAHYADVLRLRLLKLFGGVWIDATCLPTRSLDGWLPSLMQSGFFAFSTRGRNRPLSNWFLASEPINVAISRWEEISTAYWAGRGQADDYLWAHHLFDLLLRTDSKVRECWRNTPQVHSDMALLLKRALTGN
jgi:mannosyltransferase OCH1-like enzyme